jgi:hypothetical protein
LLAALFAALLTACREPQRNSPADAPAGESATPATATVDDGWIVGVPGPHGTWQDIHDGCMATWDPASLVLRIPRGEGLAGVRWTGTPPAAPFEIEFEARRTDGGDFFCGLTIPTRNDRECVSLIVGGWGGELVGISSIDDLDASENETTRLRSFETGRWYRIRLRFANERLTAAIDNETVVDLDTTGRRLSLRPGPIDACAPFGLATWETGAELRSIRWRSTLPPEPDPGGRHDSSTRRSDAGPMR